LAAFSAVLKMAGDVPLARCRPHRSEFHREETAVADFRTQVEDVKTGEGYPAKPGDLVAVHYVGTLADGTKFDSSRDRGQPFSFPLGAGRVIQGWDHGVAGMKVGGIRKLVIPPDEGYGAGGTPGGPIPPNATLHFEVELLAIR
jgi:FKBP-type peptidyl-prolyl cis-trans isomerase